MKTKKTFTLLFALVVLLPGCNPSPAPTATEEPVGLANPASVFCEENGGQVEMRTEAGGEVGYCVFPDGSECEEWAFFRNECAPGAAPVGDFQPLSQAACDGLRDTVAQVLGVEATVEEMPFADYVGGKSGLGCQVTATGTGVDFENFWSVAQSLTGALEAQGWTQDMQYQADGPTGTATGLRSGAQLCLLTSGWTPSEDADCPDDQPISACELLPEQQLYTITLACAQETAE